MPTTHLLYLHGFRSSPLSTKARLTLAVVQERYPDCVLACPALPASPAAAMALITDISAQWPRQSMAVIGSSLGGFYATALAERLGCRAVVLNPAVHPARDLAAHLGDQAVWQDPETHFVFERHFIDELAALECPHISRPERYFAVLAKGDELLDWREMFAHYQGSRIKLLEGSDHALSDYAEHLDEVLAFLF
jgi:predicted esterase YcpF (UPF0227 family)